MYKFDGTIILSQVAVSNCGECGWLCYDPSVDRELNFCSKKSFKGGEKLMIGNTERIHRLCPMKTDAALRQESLEAMAEVGMRLVANA